MSIANFHEENPQHAVILFDGVCNLCNGFVDFIIRRDSEGIFHFASLQSAFGQERAKNCERIISGADSVILVEGDRCYIRSTAVLHIVRRFVFPWNVGYILIIFPRTWRDRVYDYIARNRYRWFGKRNTCRIPTMDEKTRFIE